MSKIPIRERRKPFDDVVINDMLIHLASLKGDVFSLNFLSKRCGIPRYILRWYMPHLLDCGAVCVVGEKSNHYGKFIYKRCFEECDILGLLGVMEQMDLVRRDEK